MKHKTTAVKSAAVITIRRPEEMTPRGKRAIAKWLRMHATYLLKYGKRLGKCYRERYLYEDRARKK